MRWRKFLPLIMFVVMMVIAIAGCSNTAPLTTTIPTTTVQPSANPDRLVFPGSDNSTAPPQGGDPGERRDMPAIDYTAAALKLGVTEQQLKDALGDISQNPGDFTAAAEKLGVTMEELQDALGFKEMAPPPDGASQPPGDAQPPPAEQPVN